MKTKIFCVSWPSKLEQPMQKWLDEVGDIEIVHTSISSSTRCDYYHTGEICNTYYETTAIVIFNDKQPQTKTK